MPDKLIVIKGEIRNFCKLKPLDLGTIRSDKDELIEHHRIYINVSLGGLPKRRMMPIYFAAKR